MIPIGWESPLWNVIFLWDQLSMPPPWKPRSPIVALKLAILLMNQEALPLPTAANRSTSNLISMTMEVRAAALRHIQTLLTKLIV